MKFLVEVKIRVLGLFSMRGRIGMGGCCIYIYRLRGVLAIGTYGQCHLYTSAFLPPSPLSYFVLDPVEGMAFLFLACS